MTVTAQETPTPYLSNGTIFICLILHSLSPWEPPSSILAPSSYQQHFIHSWRKKYGTHHWYCVFKILKSLQDHLKIPLSFIHSCRRVTEMVSHFVLVKSRTDFEHHGSEFSYGQRLHARMSWNNVVLWRRSVRRCTNTRGTAWSYLIVPVRLFYQEQQPLERTNIMDISFIHKRRQVDASYFVSSNGLLTTKRKQSSSISSRLGLSRP